ncbi:hypothetical protein ACEQ8H_008265 [Pleosporales sp. CAS-2024a]
MPDLPARRSFPAVQFSSITSSRPRSPKTPWVLDVAPRWPHAVQPKAATITEGEHAIRISASGAIEVSDGLLADNGPIASSHSSKNERASQKIHNGSHITRLRLERNGNGRQVNSVGALTHAPDGGWASNDGKEAHWKPRMTAELEQLNHTTKEGRSKHWRWARTSTRSSDGGELLSHVPEQSMERKPSLNFFRRSNRISEHAERDKGQKKQSSPPASRFWWIGKQATPTRHEATKPSLIAMPPSFVPPGSKRVPTPPTLDVNGDIQGKLADFFFEHGTDITRRPKPKPKSSSEGYWDSDALLMSYFSASVDASDQSTEEEGPEGPNPGLDPRNFTVDKNDYGTPGLVETPGRGNMDIPSRSPPALVEETWFRRAQGEEQQQQTQRTAVALREIDERRMFEWIVPEHLPGSPLCPLHRDYTGYSTGMCYWHGRRRSSGSRSKTSEEFVGGVYELGAREKREKRRARQKKHGGDGEQKQVRQGRRGWEVGKFEHQSREDRQQEKKRRLQSLSSP